MFKPGGLVEPGVAHYATLTEAEKLANIETWEKNTGLKFSDQNISQRSKIRTGTITGLGKGSSTEIVLPTESEKQLIKDWEKNTGKKYKTQTASNQWKIRTGAVTGAGKSAGFDASINAIRNAFVADPDATVQELAEAIYGSDFKKADLKAKKRIINDISNDVPKFMEALSGVRKVKDFKMPNTETMLDIMDNIENNKKGFKFADQTLRNYKFRIRDVALGFEETMSLKEIDALKKLKKGMGLSLDETGTLSGTFDKAPGYTSGSQLIDDNLNVIKSKLIDKDFNNVLKAMMSDDPDKLYKWKDKQIKRDELIKLYNKNVTKFKKKYKIDAPTIEIGVNPKKTVYNYGLFSKAEQANMQDIFKNRNFSLGLGKETKPLKTLISKFNLTENKGLLGEGWSKLATKAPKTAGALGKVGRFLAHPVEMGALPLAIAAEGVYSNYASVRDLRKALDEDPTKTDEEKELIVRAYAQENVDRGDVGLEDWAIEQKDTTGVKEELMKMDLDMPTYQRAMNTIIGEWREKEAEKNRRLKELQRQRTKEAWERGIGRQSGGIVGIKLR
tara:strand:- start:27 stop:1703 length:1677 start_codon:yes stop_codon:yes gene_type:complete